MADTFYGLNLGDAEAQPFLVQVGSSTTSTDVELRVHHTTAQMTKLEARLLGEAILDFLVSSSNNNYPDA